LNISFPAFDIDMTPSTPQELTEHIRNAPGYLTKILAETGIKLE